MARKRFGERVGAVLVRDIYIGNNCERNVHTRAEGSASKSY